MYLRVILLLSVVASVIHCKDFMFSFGAKYGDTKLAQAEHAVSQVYLPETYSFNFFNTPVKQLYIDSKGVIWMNWRCPSCQAPTGFPVTNGQPLLACFWADSDQTANPSSNVFYRILTNPTTPHYQESWLNATNLLKKAFGSSVVFNGTSSSKILIIATWYNLTYNGGNCDTPTNSFQCAVISDGENTYVLFDYAQLKWSNSPSQSQNPAAAGIDTGTANMQLNNFTLAYSNTNQVLNLQDYTNFAISTTDGGPFGWSAISSIPIPTPEPYQLPEGTQLRSCWASGDPHYYTFDNHYGLDSFFESEVTCRQPSGKYVFSAAANCKNSDYPPFKVDIVTDRWEGDWSPTPLTTPTGLVVTFYFTTDIQITLQQNIWTVGTISGVANYNCPAHLCPRYTFAIQPYNFGGFVLTTNFNLTAIYYPVTGNGGYAQLYLPYIDVLNDNIFGYCGNLNNNPNDDTFCWNQGYSAAALYQNCWDDANFWTPSLSGYFSCPYNQETVSGFSSKVRAPLKTSDSSDNILTQQCNVLNDTNGVFAQCRNVPNFYSIISDCKADMNASNGAQPVLCSYASMLAQSCLTLPNVNELNWRNSSFCPIICQDNAHYSSSASRCTRTCDDQLADKFCPFPPTEGCICDDGYVYENGQCVASNLCDGCLNDNNNYVLQGSHWLTADCSQNCTCIGGSGVLCKAVVCDSQATCSSYGSSAVCQCNSGFFGNGFYCTPNDMCQPTNNCANNSTCLTSEDNGYQCLCETGYTGTFCETEIDHCSTNPCKNGVCSNSLQGYTCECQFGYSGINCDQKMDWCSSFPCTNLATCISSDINYQCVCLPGYTGQNCECPFPSISCNGLPDGNYADPCLQCANDYFSCSGDQIWIQYCPDNLYFDPVSDQCLQASSIGVCNNTFVA